MRPARSIALVAFLLITILSAASFAAAAPAKPDGNRLTYLDDPVNPYYVSRTFPKLTAAQWVGEPDVEAVVILAIDDMRDPAKYEAVLRPALERLKRIDGRAPVSIMTCKVDPADPQLQKWLKEGLNFEVHTIDHPCPLLAGGDFAKARATYDQCVDLLNKIPGDRPVAFRMPCCDSLNTPSPRFWASIFNRTTQKGQFLTIDSSVFNVPTPNDPDLPRNFVLDDQARERFRRYLPFPSFVNTIEDYPYPYVIGKLCWEFPCVVPSDWESFNIQGKASPKLLEDWKAALDATVIKGGTFTLVFHPYGWSSPQQLADLVDYADKKYGKKVKFLNFREAQERLDKNLLAGQPLRAANGQDNGVRLMDVNGDGYMDVVIGNEHVRETRIWSQEARSWATVRFPSPIVNADGFGNHSDAGVRFGIGARGHVTAFVDDGQRLGAWAFDGDSWRDDVELGKLLQPPAASVQTVSLGMGRDRGVRFRDLDGDGRCEVISSSTRANFVLRWDATHAAWSSLPWGLPEGAAIVTPEGGDAGLRFVDVDGDGHDDLVFSNMDGYFVRLWESLENGWARPAMTGKASDKAGVPTIVRRDGSDNGVWFHSRTMWVQNEDTAGLADHVDRMSFNEMLGNVEPNYPRSPAAALASLRVRPGFQVQQMAAEPLVEDPIAYAWGADGKLWVVEMGDYPLGLDGKGKFGGRVKFLEDTDGDGVYDKATVFLDNLGYPTGVMPWRKGVLVTCAPDLFYAEDTDGDGKADKKEVLFTGIKEGNQQHRVNGLIWGLDNWVYCANSDGGGPPIRSAKTGAVVGPNGRDFRFRPDDGTFELTAGRTQYGLARDDWGDWFGCDNSNPLMHYPLEDRYLRRNPYLAPPKVRVDVPEIPGAAPVYPVSRTIARYNDFWAANHFTSANSTMIYRDNLFGPAFAGNNFVSEPVHNLVHREIVSPDGVTFAGHRADDERDREFLASIDNWFRPTMLKTGPDGALWVADMYRYVIEHPQWIPKDVQARVDLRAGQDKGRLYRIFPVGVKPRGIPRLDKLDAAGLVAGLDSPSGWQRDMVQQLLFERQDKSAVPLLEKLAVESKNPLARLHALCTLEGLGASNSDVLKRALADDVAGVRRHAVRLAEPLLAKHADLGEAVAKLADDADAHVRQQVAYMLGEWDDPRAAEALAGLAVRSGDDPFILTAALSSVNKSNFNAVLKAVPAAGRAPSPELLSGLFRIAAGLHEDRAIVTLLDAVTAPKDGKIATWQYATMDALLDRLAENGRTLANIQQGDAAHGQSLQRVEELFARARSLANDANADAAERSSAVRLLGRDPEHRSDDAKLLTGLLNPQTPDAIQAAAVSALAKSKLKETPQLLLDGWKGYSPAIRAAVLDALLARPEGATALVDAMEAKRVLPADVDAPRRQKLLKVNGPASLRDRAAKLLADAINPDRQKVIDAFAPTLTLTGDGKRGAEFFGKTCATCHQVGQIGHAVGPDLASVGDKSPEGLLISILDPNRAVDPKFVGYVAETKDGETITGVLSAEAGGSVTILQADGNPRQVLRSDLKTLRSTGQSLMPEGLEAGLKPQDLADLIAYVRSAGPQPARKTMEGNRPEVVLPDGKGVLRLTAGNAEIYGFTLVLERQYGNLGMWTSDNDHATWSVQPARAGKYAVWIDYACEDKSAGNAYVLQAGTSQLGGRVAGTKNWDTYRRIHIGDISLTAGRQRVTLRPEGKIVNALLDLKTIELIPVAGE